MKGSYNVYRTALLTLLGLLLSRPLLAQEVTAGWHDHIYLQPGDGVRLNRLLEPIYPGLVVMSTTGTTNGNTGGQQETVAFAQHTYNMIQTLNVDSSASLNLLAFSGDIGVSFFGRQTFNANDLTFVVTTTKNYGTTKFAPLNFSSNFWNAVAAYPANLQGTALYSAMTSQFGTHYVAGYQSEALVSVIYSFHYASASVRQQLLASAGSSWDFGSFSAFVSSFFGSTNTTASMSYQFYSTDPNLLATNFGFASAGTVQNLSQFSNFVNQVQNYANSMTQTNAKITGYVLDPLWFGPGILPLLGGYVPPAPSPTDYNGFLQAYAALESWKQSLDPWILNGDTLSWLNAQGRQVVQTSWLNAVKYLAEMKAIAVGHYSTNSPLNVPAEVSAYLGNLNTIKLPFIYVMDSFVSGDRYVIGRVDCGCRDLTIPIPFNTITELYYQTNNGTLAPIFYDPVEFQNVQLSAFKSGTVHTYLVNRFASAEWACLTNSVTNPDLNGFFLMNQTTSQAPNWSLAVSGGTDVNGNTITVDEMAFLDTRSGSCPGSCLVTFTNLVSASAITPSAFNRGAVGVGQPGTTQGANKSAIRAYGSENLAAGSPTR
jgi:hypothetical protein